MLHDLASAAAEWLADPRQGLGSAAPPRQPEAGAEAADGGGGQALQHIDQVLRLPNCSRSNVVLLCCRHARWHLSAQRSTAGAPGWLEGQPAWHNPKELLS
jgi:hypothetical protein